MCACIYWHHNTFISTYRSFGASVPRYTCIHNNEPIYQLTAPSILVLTVHTEVDWILQSSHSIYSITCNRQALRKSLIMLAAVSCVLLAWEHAGDQV